MKTLSVRLKITLWFAMALLAVVILTCLTVLYMNGIVLRKTIQDNLIETVENNVDEVEYYKDIADIAEPDDVDIFIGYGGGYLEVDDDFLNAVNDVFTALYDGGKHMLYGENPVERYCAGVPFSDREVQTVKAGSVRYYIFDRKLTGNGLDGLWLRGVVPETQGKEDLTAVAKLTLMVLPLILVAAVLGGYLLAGRVLRPIKKIGETASRISRGNDLKKRIELGNGRDELHQLADTFNGMFSRLEDSFEKEKRFTSDVSHELRTPMAVIMAQCEYSLEHDGSPEEYLESIQTIYRQGKKMTGLINRMLDLARLELRPDNYPKETVDFSALVRAVSEDMSLIREKGITLDKQIEDGLSVMGNEGLLTRALSNLILNAYRYGKENGHITVSLKKQGKGCLLQVADDGIGIAEEDIPKLFDRFFRADASRTESGSGLGLSLVKEIAEFHAARVSVESKPDKGSVFSILF